MLSGLKLFRFWNFFFFFSQSSCSYYLLAALGISFRVGLTVAFISKSKKHGTSATVKSFDKYKKREKNVCREDEESFLLPNDDEITIILMIIRAIRNAVTRGALKGSSAAGPLPRRAYRFGGTAAGEHMSIVLHIITLLPIRMNMLTHSLIEGRRRRNRQSNLGSCIID